MKSVYDMNRLTTEELQKSILDELEAKNRANFRPLPASELAELDPLAIHMLDANIEEKHNAEEVDVTEDARLALKLQAHYDLQAAKALGRTLDNLESQAKDLEAVPQFNKEVKIHLENQNLIAALKLLDEEAAEAKAAKDLSRALDNKESADKDFYAVDQFNREVEFARELANKDAALALSFEHNYDRQLQKSNDRLLAEKLTFGQDDEDLALAMHLAPLTPRRNG